MYGIVQYAGTFQHRTYRLTGHALSLIHILTGPTTLGAILNSLQMGFRTLAIQKRTGEVWTVLGAVKTEFSKFGGLLEKVQKNLQSAGDQLEEVMGKRTRDIERKLRQVEPVSYTHLDVYKRQQH